MKLTGNICKLMFFTCMIFAGSCVTESGDLKSSALNKEKDFTIRIKVKGSDFTRSGEDELHDSDFEERIDNLRLAFYHDTQSGWIHAKTLEGIKDPETGDFVVVYSSSPDNLPDVMVAVANLADENIDLNKDLLNHRVECPWTSFSMTMGSVRFFDDLRQDVRHTFLKDENFTESEPVEVRLERTAGKITLNKKADSEYDEVKMKLAGNEVKLILHIDKWDIYATDRETFTIKNLGEGNTYFSLENELGDLRDYWNENSQGSGVVHWSHSVNYSMKDFPKPGEEVPEGPTMHFAYGEMKNTFQESSDGTVFTGSCYCNETTRPSEVFDIPNSLPSVAIAGHYEVEGKGVINFYRHNDEIIEEKDFLREMSLRQKSIFKKEGNLLPAPEEFMEIAEVVTFSNSDKGYGDTGSHYAVRLKEEADVSNFCDINGEPLKDSELINESLINSCFIWEKYYMGKTLFTFPVVHRQVEGEEKRTGNYGIVRNHHYTISLNSISGIGRGIADNSIIIGDAPEIYEYPDFNINFSIFVEDWITEEIEVTAEK